MLQSRYIWLLLCYAQFSRSNLQSEYEEVSHGFDHDKGKWMLTLPFDIGVDEKSGCMCRTTADRSAVVCFGNYECKSFPKVKAKSNILRVRTSVMTEIKVGDLDTLTYLDKIEIEANFYLKFIEPGSFRNLSNLEQLSISYSRNLKHIYSDTFVGLTKLKNLTMVGNGFTNIMELTSAFRPIILPSLESLDLSENIFMRIPKKSFYDMNGTKLRRLELDLCQLDFIHPSSMLPFRHLKELSISDNELNATIIEAFLTSIARSGINLIYLNLSGLGFRKYPPRSLLNVIANTTVKRLFLANNQFEVLFDDMFPIMANIEVLDLRRVLAVKIGQETFGPTKFPNLKALFLGGNNLAGVHTKHLSPQLKFLDLSYNTLSSPNPMYFQMDKDIFMYAKELLILDLSFNRIKAVFDYTFRGLSKLKILSMENGTLVKIGSGTFKSTPQLELLNLGNNFFYNAANFTSDQFEGLHNLKVLFLNNCGIRHFNDDDNIFEMMPNLTHLMLGNNQLYFITPTILKPLKLLKVLDLSHNLLLAWGTTLYLSSGVKPVKLYLRNNKISHITLSMLKDFSYLLENRNNLTTQIDLSENVFVCDCSAMFSAHTWLEANGSNQLKEFIRNSNFQCSSPDIWENVRVADYLNSIKSLQCVVYDKLTNAMFVIWTIPAIVLMILIIFFVIWIFKYRIYMKYWLFLAKLALGKRLIGSKIRHNCNTNANFKYDAFVSYCNEDREFVANMINKLEKEPPFLKLCVYERDFEIGSFISEAILKSINESKYVILVVSNSFSKSQWCRWETQLAEYHRIFSEDIDTYDPLVLIRIGDIENKYLTTTLKFLLKTKIYLTWTEDHSEVFWEKLKNLVAKNQHN